MGGGNTKPMERTSSQEQQQQEQQLQADEKEVYLPPVENKMNKTNDVNKNPANDSDSEEDDGKDEFKILSDEESGKIREARKQSRRLSTRVIRIARNDEQNRSPAMVAKMMSLHKRGKTLKTKKLQQTNFEGVTNLPRGGVYVNTKQGPVQFGIPPETVKDSMNLGMQVPTVFVVPRDRFNMHAGINVSEIEFPAFFNFFVLKRQVTLVTYQYCCDDLMTIMTEALDGPKTHQLYTDSEYSKFADKKKFDCRPNHPAEIAYFCEPRPPDYTIINVNNLIKFKFFNSMGECHLDDGVVIKDKTYGYTIEQDDQLIANISDEEARSCFLPVPCSNPTEQPSESSSSEQGDTNDSTEQTDESEKEQQQRPVEVNASLTYRAADISSRKQFIIPKFGLTVLGNSHGFDPSGSTSGFVIWINGQGIMVDPPPHSGQILLGSGIQPKSITATILTHCHADHDAGTIQKMITEDKVTLLTTRTIFESLLRKYSGVSGLPTVFLEQLVNFRSVYVEEPTYWNGATFRFFYSLHAIPCVGFEVSFEGKSIVYSADTYYEPSGLNEMCQREILSEGRRDTLINFPWHCDIVLHEAGVPPIHTPVSALLQLPEQSRKNIRLIHIGGKAAQDAVAQGFQIAQPGVDNTVVLIEAEKDKKEILSFLQLVASVDIFRSFTIPQTLELIHMSHQHHYLAGETIAEEGRKGEKLYIIKRGEASVIFNGVKKLFKVGDYLGEISVITAAKRSATIKAETEVETVEVDKYAFNYFLTKDPTLARNMDNLIKARSDGSWKAIDNNTILRSLSASQKTQLQKLLTVERLKKGDCLFRRGDQAEFAVLVSRGQLVFQEIHHADPEELAHNISGNNSIRSLDEIENVKKLDPLTTGAFICDMYGMHSDLPLTLSLICDSDEAVVFTLKKGIVLGFLDQNPMILLAFLKSILIL